MWDSQLTPPVSQVLPSSKSRDTKTRTDIKNSAGSNLDIVLQLKNQQSLAKSAVTCQISSHLPAPVENGGQDRLKMEEFLTYNVM